MKLLHSVLGTEYEVLLGDKKEIGISEEYMGECRSYGRKILVCTEKGECTDEELIVKTQEIVAHEFFHAYLNETGIVLDTNTEELMADFFMKNWRKMNNSILEVLDKSGFLDK